MAFNYQTMEWEPEIPEALRLGFGFEQPQSREPETTFAPTSTAEPPAMVGQWALPKEGEGWSRSAPGATSPNLDSLRRATEGRYGPGAKFGGAGGYLNSLARADEINARIQSSLAREQAPLKAKKREADRMLLELLSSAARMSRPSAQGEVNRLKALSAALDTQIKGVSAETEKRIAADREAVEEATGRRQKLEEQTKKDTANQAILSMLYPGQQFPAGADLATAAKVEDIQGKRADRAREQRATESVIASRQAQIERYKAMQNPNKPLTQAEIIHTVNAAQRTLNAAMTILQANPEDPDALFDKELSRGILRLAEGQIRGALQQRTGQQPPGASAQAAKLQGMIKNYTTLPPAEKAQVEHARALYNQYTKAGMGSDAALARAAREALGGL